MSEVFATKLAAVALCLAVYLFSFRTDTVSPLQIGSAMLLLLVAAPLGYDTLLYKEMIEQSLLARYGPLWRLLGVLGGYCGWLSVYVTVYTLVLLAFWRLSGWSRWPSLCFAILSTAPGIGLAFLGILRQALATAFVILAFRSVVARRLFGSATWTLLALAAHPASAVPLAYVYLGRNAGPLKARAAIAGMVLVAGLAWATLSPETSGQILYFAAYMVAMYIAGDTVIEGDWGRKLFLFWTVMLLSPIALRRLLSDSEPPHGGPASSVTVIGTLCLYGMLVVISGSAVRIAWYLLPFAIVPITDRLMWLRHKSGLWMPLIYACMLLLASAYAIYLAEGHFWLGEYSHTVALPVD